MGSSHPPSEATGEAGPLEKTATQGGALGSRCRDRECAERGVAGTRGAWRSHGGRPALPTYMSSLRFDTEPDCLAR